MQGDGPVDGDGMVGFAHAGVHLGVRHAEDQRLVAHQRLVVGFAVADVLFLGAAGGQLVPHLEHIPLIVGIVLEQLDPEVRNAHGQAVVEADAAAADGDAHAGHAAHLLADGQREGIDGVDQLVGQLQIGQRVHVGVQAEVLGIVGEAGAESVILIDHRGDAVEAEAVEVVLLQPEFQVGQQEMQHLVLAVVEQLGCSTPDGCRGRRQEVLVVGAVETWFRPSSTLADACECTTSSSTYSQLMRLIDQMLQVVRRAEEVRRGGKEVAHLIAEGAVEGVLHDRHDLHGVVAQIVDDSAG